MAELLVDQAFRNVLAYPASILEPRPGGVRVPVTYRAEWQDGYGARGWKLDAAVGDDEIIASTRETGDRIPTSVFVHDLLDHFLSGFALSGHWAEAMALGQLQRRTGTDICPDYAQMVREDLMGGRLIGPGGDLRGFIGEDLSGLAEDPGLGDRELVLALSERLGEGTLEAALVERFFVIGREGIAHSARSLRALGLDDELCREMGLALQAALSVVDRRLEGRRVEHAHGFAWVSNEACALDVESVGARSLHSEEVVRLGSRSSRSELGLAFASDPSSRC